MNYFSKDEKLAVTQLAKRVASSPGGEWRDWDHRQILDPDRKTFAYDDTYFHRLPHHRAGRSVIRRIDDYEKFVLFRELLRDFPPFITVENYYYKAEMCKICPWRGVGGGNGEVDGEVIAICLVEL